MKKIVCLWGGPGTGKSTTCAGIFHRLKTMGFNTEMNREYIKEWVWEKRKVLPGDQVYVTAKQARREVIYMREGLDFIVSDSPLALATFYGDTYDPFEKFGQASKSIVKQHHEICKHYGYKVEHFFLIRTKNYNPAGRNEDEQTAKEFDVKIREFLDSYPIKYNVVQCDANVEDTIIKHLLKKQCLTCPEPAEADHYKYCKACWWARDPRNPEFQKVSLYDGQKTD